MNKTILVTGAGGGSGLSTVRLLKQDSSYNVIAADVNENATGLYLADKKIIVPRAADNGYVDFLRQLVASENIDLIIPNVDEELEIFASNKDIFPQVLISPLETTRICNDKLRTIQHFKDIISTPKVFLSHELISDEDFPLFVKPRISRGSRNTYKVSNNSQLLSLIGYLKSINLPVDKLLISEYLPGREYTIEALCDINGKCVVGIPRTRLAVQGGVCSVGEVVRNEKIIDITKKITDNLTFIGPINIQLKEDKLGNYKIMEINPRIAGGTPISYKCGLNIPLLAAKMFFNEEIAREEFIYREGIVFRHLAEI